MPGASCQSQSTSQKRAQPSLPPGSTSGSTTTFPDKLIKAAVLLKDPTTLPNWCYSPKNTLEMQQRLEFHALKVFQAASTFDVLGAIEPYVSVSEQA